MEEQTQNRNDNLTLFIKKYGWLLSAICGIISILCLLGVVVSYKIKVGEVKTEYTLHLFDFFKGTFSKDWTMIVTLILIVSGIVCVLLHPVIKEFEIAGSMLFILGAIMLMLVRFIFIENEIPNFYSATIGWGSIGGIASLIIGSILSLSSSLTEKKITTRDIAEDGILIAAAFILNLIKLPIATGGGSVNFQMLPLFLIALRHGPTQGLVCGGIIYGFLTCLTDGYGFATYPFDYLVPFGSVLIIGYFRPLIFSEKQTTYNLLGEIFILLSCTLATMGRFIGSTASSMILYGLSFRAAVDYNAIYIPVSGAIATAVLMMMYGPLIQINKRYPVNK